MKVYIVECFEDIPYGEYQGIEAVYFSRELAEDYALRRALGGYSYFVTEEETLDEPS